MSTADAAERMERVFYDLHRRASLLALRRTSHRTRSLVEHSALVSGVCAFCVVLLCHRTFVYRGVNVGGTFGGGGLGGKVLDGLFASAQRATQNGNGDGSILGTKGGTLPAGCLRGVPGFDEGFDVLQIGIGGEDLETSYAITVPPTSLETRADAASASSPPQQKDLDEPFSPLYSYSLTKGLLLLSPKIQRKHNITVHRVVISQTDPRCFGEPFLQNLVFGVVGPSTVAMNWLLALNDGIGYVLPRTGHVVDLDRYSSQYYFWLPRAEEGAVESTACSDYDEYDSEHNGSCRPKPQRGQGGGAAAGRGRSYILFKLGVLSASLFLFFVTTTLVAFTLRETQDRMLNFTFQLQERVRNHEPLGRLIATHVIENMVFVPIMLGTIFFLIEFYGGDKFLAFMVFSMVWVCEVFSVISMRSLQGMQFFPRVFFLYFTLFHAYYFSCPFGFSYASLASTVLFLTHSMLFFWNRYELPAIVSESVNADSPRQMVGTRSPATPVALAANRPPPISTVLLQPEEALDGTGPHLLPRPLARNQNHPSFPSMSSLGRGSVAGGSNFLFQDGVHNNGDDGSESSYMFYLNGEVVMHRDDRNPRFRSPSASIISPSTSGEPETTPESTPESQPPAAAAALEAAAEAAFRAASGSLGSSSAVAVHEAESSPTTGGCSGEGRGESSPQTPRVRNGPSPNANADERPGASTTSAQIIPSLSWDRGGQQRIQDEGSYDT